jgi:hypothetical protein
MNVGKMEIEIRNTLASFLLGGAARRPLRRLELRPG